MSKDNGGPAFPVPGFEYLDDRDAENPERVAYLPAKGMTLRDYFAAKAMQGLCADPSTAGTRVNDLASDAYEIADAMLEARK